METCGRELTALCLYVCIVRSCPIRRRFHAYPHPVLLSQPNPVEPSRHGTTYFSDTNWLGTEVRHTLPGGSNTSTCTGYLPFGDGATCTGTIQGWNQPGFAGQWTDYETGGNVHMSNRNYTAMSGRFNTPDPTGSGAADPSNPQSCNQYAYALNNPISNVDPTGLDGEECDTPGDCGSGPSDEGNSLGEPVNPNALNGWDLSLLPPILASHSQCDENGENCFIVGDKIGECLPSTAGVVCWDGSQWAAQSSPKEDGINWDWGWSFTRSFFTFAGGPGGKPTCTGQALSHIGNTLNPFTPGVSTATDAAAPVAQAMAINQSVAQTQAGIDAYIGAKGLTVPLRSSIVRAMAAEGAEGAVAAGARANLAVQTIAIDYAAVNSAITTSGEARNGQCAAAFPVIP
jgi:RHS repeat-associated protein